MKCTILGLDPCVCALRDEDVESILVKEFENFGISSSARRSIDERSNLTSCSSSKRWTHTHTICACLMATMSSFFDDICHAVQRCSPSLLLCSATIDEVVKFYETKNCFCFILTRHLLCVPTAFYFFFCSSRSSSVSFIARAKWETITLTTRSATVLK